MPNSCVLQSRLTSARKFRITNPPTMILRKMILLLLLMQLATTKTQNARSYDTNEWIPINPSNADADNAKKATGRVLNLDVPNQKFFPDDEYVRKRPQVVQQFLREPLPPIRPHVRKEAYKFDIPKQQPPPPPPPPQYQQLVPPQQQFFLPEQLNQELVAPPQQNQPNFYQNNNQIIQHANSPYHIPFNQTFYQSLNPGIINQEILGAIQSNHNLPAMEATSSVPKLLQTENKETVQLLYVPFENLKQAHVVGQEPALQEKQIDRAPLQNAKQGQLRNIEQDFIQQALEAHKLQQQIQLGQPILLQSSPTTTVKPKKRKPHQPPLAVFMESQSKASVADVLGVLRNAKSISVQDSINSETPPIFVGPSSLAPSGYTKFPLPYLSNVAGNRIERKVDHLPFFVAPLSYKTPEGYSKIPLPSPHVGSVVVATKEDLVTPPPPPPPPQSLPLVQNQLQQQYEDTSLQQSFGNLAVTPKLNQFDQYQEPLRKNNDFSTLSVGSTSTFNLPLQSRPTEPTPLSESSFKLHNFNNAFASQNPSDSVANRHQYNNNVQLTDYTNVVLSPQKSTVVSPTQNPYKLVQENDYVNLFAISRKPTETTTNKNQFHLDNIFGSQEPIKSSPPTSAIPTQNPYLIQDQTYRPLRQKVSTETVPTQTPYVEQTYNKPVRQKSTTETIPTQNPYLIQEQTYKPVRQKSLPAPVPIENPYINQEANHNGFTSLRSVSQKDILPEGPTSYPNLFSASPLNLLPNTNQQQNPTQPINQFEAQQIKQFSIDDTQTNPTNSQFRSEYSNNPSLIASSTPTISNYEPITTPRSKTKIRQRVRTTRPTASPTSTNLENNKYTVLEEFSLQTKSSTTPKYTTEVETIPANVYKINPEQVTPYYLQNQQIQQHVLNQDLMDQQILHAHKEQSDPNIATLIYNRGAQQQTYNAPTQEQGTQFLPGLINNLQDQTISNLQEQTIRQLLVPNLLVPTTEKLLTPISKPTTEQVEFTPKLHQLSSTETPHIETTTQQKRTRGRQRVSTNRYSTTTPTSRRTVNRRRPTYTKSRTTTEYIPIENYETTTKRNQIRQRFRTRGRPLQQNSDHSATERVYQTNSAESRFKQPLLEGGFQASVNEPQSYMQFEHTIDEQQVITIKPTSEEISSKEYHQIYNIPTTTTSEAPKDDNVKTQKPVVDIQITHPLIEKRKEPINKPPNDVQYSFGQGSSNLANKVQTTTKSSVKIRARTRGRSRFTTTHKPTTTITTTTTTVKPTIKEEEEDDEEEYYGFIRQPSFNKPLIQTTSEQPIALYSSSYKSTEKPIIQVVEEEEVPESTPVQFIGEIRPKYSSTITTPQYEEDVKITTETPKVRSRGRIRVPVNRQYTNHHRQYNEVSTTNSNEQTTRRPVRTRNRGKSHYKLPESLTQRKTDDEDVDGGNYPSSYLKNKDATTRATNFQITVDPYEEEALDQVPYSSIYRPKILPNPNIDWVEASGSPPPFNNIEFEDKKLVVPSSIEDSTALPLSSNTDAASTQPEEVTSKQKGRRRGVWKLVRHRPVDYFETAESQNYQSVINSFSDIYKIRPTTTTEIPTTTTEENILDTLYSMFAISGKGETSTSTSSTSMTTTEKEETSTTTQLPPTFPDEFTENFDPTTTVVEEKNVNTSSSSLTTLPITTTVETPTKTYDVEPWHMHPIKTSTSTEISHETEICYKGRCVKSSDNS